jgi:hypothetical protein
MRQTLLCAAVVVGLALTAGTAQAQDSSQSYGQNRQSTGNGQYGTSGWGDQQNGSQSYNSQQYGQPSWNQSYGTQSGSNQSSRSGQQFTDVKRLLGEEVNDQQGNTAGHIKDIVFNAQTGEIFAAIGLNNGQTALVPAKALKISSSQGFTQVTLNTSKQNLQSAPTVQNHRFAQALERPGFTQRVYSHFNVQQPYSAMGGSGQSSYSGSSTGSSYNPDQGQSGSQSNYQRSRQDQDENSQQ